MTHLRHLLVVVLLMMGVSASALQIQTVTLLSPITNQPFDTVTVPMQQVVGEALADMGYDDDGCRHTSGLSEYAYYIATDPYCYFSALSAEWNEKTGRFEGNMPPDMKEWVIKEFNSEWQIDENRSYSLAVATAQAQGQPNPERKGFYMQQQSIPLEKRYRFALQCYLHRGARPVVVAKTALMGAWSLRSFLNIPIGHQALDGGYEEVNDKIKRHIKDGEAFQIAKWQPIYQEIFEKENLTSEGYMVAGLAYFGLVLRSGDKEAADAILTKLTDKFKDMAETKTKGLLLGIVRERRRVMGDYDKFLSIATDNFIQSIRDEEFTRDDLVNNKMLVVAEGLRRTGRLAEAYDWYLALAQMIETQPKLRAEIHGQGKSPAADSPQAVQVGWIADSHLEALTKGGLIHANSFSEHQKDLLNEIVFNGLGKPDYVNPNWKPMTGLNADDCRRMLELIGKSMLEYNFRLGQWPSSLNEMWDHQILRDRNRVNRFYDPVKGKPLLYSPPATSMEQISPQTVLVCTAEPVASNQGDVYFAFLANMKTVYSIHPQKPGEPFVK